MDHKLFSDALGLSEPWFVKGLDFDKGRHRLTVRIDFPKDARFAVGGDGGQHPVHDTQTQCYRYLNFFQHECELEARVPQVRLPKGEMVWVEPPWAGRVRKHDDAALFVKEMTEAVAGLQAFVKGFVKGSQTTIPQEAIEAMANWCSHLNALNEFVRLANLIEEAAASLGVKASQLNAHWKLPFFQSPEKRKNLLTHTEKITKKSVQERAAKALDGSTKLDDLERNMEKHKKSSQIYLEMATKHGDFVKRFQDSRQEFIELISAPGKPFDPEHRYLDDWKRFMRDRNARVKMRGVDPNGDLVKALRVKRGWTQHQLRVEVQKRTDDNLNIRTIRRVEASERVDTETIKAIAKTLDQYWRSLVL